MSQKKFLVLCLISTLIGFLSTVIAKILLIMIGFFTNLFWFQRISFGNVNLGNYHFSWPYIFVPALGGLIIGVIAKYGSENVRGHGIPEVMENILSKGSRIPRRMTILKPLTSAISIGSGGPFGAEGPIIATGSAFGSWIGRHLYFSERERKILLAVGAASGMTAVFGTPLAALFLCIELLLFEFSARSFIPVLLAVSASYTVRLAGGHTHPEFPIGDVHETITGSSTTFYFIVGAITGAVSCLVTKLVFSFEHLFKKLPIHWVWWPMIGGLLVGIIGVIDSRTLGVGYSNISIAVQGKLLLIPAISLFAFKLLSWTIALGSGTAGGTLAPLLMLGSSLGTILYYAGKAIDPSLEILPEVAALVGMSAMFSGSTRAILTSTILALEVTGTHFGVAPLLLGNCAAYLLSLLLLKETIMTEALVKKGIKVPDEYLSGQ